MEWRFGRNYSLIRTQRDPNGGRGSGKGLATSPLPPLSLAVYIKTINRIIIDKCQTGKMSLKDFGTHSDFWLFHKFSLSFWLFLVLIASGVGYLWC